MLGLVVRRLRGRPALAAAVLLTVLITTTVLTALVAFDRTVGEAGLRQALQGPGRARTTVLVTSTRDAAARPHDEATVRTFAQDLFGSLPTTVESVPRSRSYGLPAAGTATAAPTAAAGSPTGKDPDLTLLAALDPSRVELTAGRLPARSGAPGAPGEAAEAAVPQAALTRLGLTPDALPAAVVLDDRFGGPPLTLRITGAYRALNRAAPYWRLDPLGGREIQVVGFTTYGPMLVDDTVFTSGTIPQYGQSWLVTAGFATVRPAEVDALRARSGPLQEALQRTGGLQVRTELPVLIADLRTDAALARSTLLVGALQLAVLAAAALLLVVRLMAARQESENTLLAARGAARRQLAALAAVEALLLALPAAVLAPLLTPLLLRALGRFGPLAAVPLDTGPRWTLWPVAAGCALACVALTAAPALLRRVGALTLRRAGRRQPLVAGTARSGADLALLVLAVLAYQQLARHGHGGPGPDGAARAGVDPVLVAAPTLALGAGSLLVLRTLPYAARLAGTLAARGRGLATALVSWQLARRPARSTGPVLLLTLAVSSGVLALGQHTAWSDSQRDQADFATAGGLRITASSVAPIGQGGRYGTLPGGDRLIPVVRSDQPLPGGRTGQLLALDTARAADHLPVRADLLDGRTVRELFGPLAPTASDGAGLQLPGHPVRIDLELGVLVRSRSVWSPDGGPAAPSAAPSRPELWLLLTDRLGVTHRVAVPALPAEGGATVSVDLAAAAGGPLGSVAAPLTLAGFVVAGGTQPGERVEGELTVRRITASDSARGPGTDVAVPAGLGWSVAAPAGGPTGGGSWTPVAADRTALLVVGYRAGPTAGVSARATLTPSPGGRPPAAARELPALATRGYLDAVGAAVGDLVRAPLGGSAVPLRITAAVGSLPAVGDTAVVVDLAAAGRLLAAAGEDRPVPTEWWLPAADPHDDAPVRAAAALRASAGAETLDLREETAAALLADPIGAAPQSALAALAVAAAVLAAIGFTAAAAAGAAERARESAVLLALGAPRRRLARTAVAEQAVLVGLGTALGLALGTLIAHLVVPLVVLTPAAGRPVPEVLVDLPAGPTALLAAAVAAGPLLSAVLGGRRHRDLAARLRFVEET
ncbi:FtsX-like permease family protein [Kitasatospora sp. NPDC088346]|uniref:FtsX-like permease family protein n=1 Tax=Kitasatospora sp. NPDC088346 TaxID=3364073 RepID=UPI00382AAD3B